MRLVAVLDGLPDDRDARRAQQLAQLGEVVAVRSAAMQKARCFGASLLLDGAGGA